MSIDETGERTGAGDVALYRAVVNDLRSGDNYYPTVNRQLRERGYPTRSIFNWRTPLPHVLLGQVPGLVGKGLLILVAMLAIGLSYELLMREGGASAAITGAALLTGATLPVCLGDLYVMPLLWAGIFILLAVTLSGLNYGRLAVVAALAAALSRDLAVPLLVLLGCYSLWLRDWRAAGWWGAAFLIWAMYFAWHFTSVLAFTSIADPAHPHGWIAFGGWPFLVAISQMNAYLLVTPQILAAVYLPLAICGFASWNTQAGTRATLVVMSYLVVFSVVGQPFNQYWGSLLAPLMCLGAGMSIVTIRDLLCATGLMTRAAA